MLYAIDFETVADSYIKTFTIRNKKTRQLLLCLNVSPPHNWHDVVFKQMLRRHYYASPGYLDWRDGDVDYADLRDVVLSHITLNDDVCVNNESKAYILESFGFLNIFVCN